MLLVGAIALAGCRSGEGTLGGRTGVNAPPSPSPTLIAFTSNRDGVSNEEIYVMNPDGTNQRNLTKSWGDDFAPACSPDGTKIAFVSDRPPSRFHFGWYNEALYVTNRDGTRQKKLADEYPVANASWSPDGSTIALTCNYERYVNGFPRRDCEIFVMSPDGTNQVNLTNNGADDLDPCWSPDGTKIAFCSNRDSVGPGSDEARHLGEAEIYVMNADGSNPKRLTDDPFPDSSPAWSPDGTRIAFASCRGGNTDIFVKNADGTKVRRLTDNLAGDRQPCWSPDGKKIAFASERDGNWEIYVMNADGTEQQRLTNNPARDMSPAWSPS